MLNDPLLLTLLTVSLGVAVVGIISFARTFGTAALRRLPFVGPSNPPMIFVRWLTAEQIDALRNAGINCAPHTVRNERGVSFDGKELKRALQALNAHVLATFGTEQGGVVETVLMANRQPDPAMDKLKVELVGRLQHSKSLFWRHIIGRRRIERVVRCTLLPLIRKNVKIYFLNGRTTAVPDDDNFHIFFWSSAGGSWRHKPPERLWGVPVPSRAQGFNASGNGISIVESSSDYSVAELVGNNALYVHFDALSQATDLELALLARIFDAVREEWQVDKFLAEIVNAMPADGLPIGAANAGNLSVFDQGFSGRRLEVVRSLIREILLPAVRKDVFVKNCAGRNQEPLEDGMFHVFFHSAPLGQASMQTPERLWGYRLLKSEQVFLPSGRGRPIADETGFVIGELAGNNLYIFGDLIHHACSKGSLLLAKLLMEVRREIALADDTAHVDRVFADECWKQIRSITKIDPDIERKAKAAEMQLSTLLRSASNAEQEFLRLQSTPGEAIGQEFDEICKIKKVLDVAVSDTYITVTTDTLYCVDPRDGIRHEIGAFKISIPTSRNGAVHWANQTRRVAGAEGRRMNAPHVNGEGYACLGNTKDVFPDLIGRREFACAIELAIAFVESVNVSDAWGKFISNWPVAQD